MMTIHQDVEDHDHDQGQFPTLDDDQLQHDVDDQNDDQGDVFGDVMLTIIMNTGVCLSVKSVHIKIQL